MSHCVVCHRSSEVYLCGGCWTGLERSLADVAWVAEELTTTLTMQAKMSDGAGWISNSKGEPIPLNTGAMDAGTRLRDILWSWCRDLQETNGDGPLGIEPTVIPLSRWLMRHPTWIAVHPAVDDLYDEITEVIKAAKRAVDIPLDRRVFLGKCGSNFDGILCDEELFVGPHAHTAVCRTCSAEWDVAERRKWMLSQVEHEVAQVPVLSALLTRLGVPIGAEVIRRYAREHKIFSAGEDRNRRKSYRVGDILDAFMGPERHAS